MAAAIPEVVIWLVVALIGVPAACRNPTAAALVLSWLAGQAFYLVTGNNLPVDFYLFPDVFVLAVIFAKAEATDCKPYRGTWHQIRCIFLERGSADRVVMAIFPVMWTLYAMDIHPFYKWYALYFLVIAQFAAVGIEALVECQRERKARAPENPSGGEFHRLAWGRGYG